jgi:hypothetical protein
MTSDLDKSKLLPPGYERGHCAPRSMCQYMNDVEEGCSAILAAATADSRDLD